jgi:hypothetical protein
VIGYDHRVRGSLSSERFAVLAAAAFLHAGARLPPARPRAAARPLDRAANAGTPVQLYRGPVATPLVPWAVAAGGALAGVCTRRTRPASSDAAMRLARVHPEPRAP